MNGLVSQGTGLENLKGVSDMAKNMMIKYKYHEILNEQLVVGSSNDPIENMHCLSLSEEDKEKISVNDILCFLESVKEERSMQSKKLGIPMIFYCWVDSLAGQIRFSVIPGEETDSLPFGCTVIPINELSFVIKDYFENHLNFIPFSSLELINEIDEEEEELEHKLVVYSCKL